MFGGLNLLERMKPKWEETLKGCEGDEEKREVLRSRDEGCMYLMCLMMSYKAGGGRDKGLEEALEKARTDEGERGKYGRVGKLSDVERFLGIADNPEEELREEETAIEQKE